MIVGVVDQEKLCVLGTCGCEGAREMLAGRAAGAPQSFMISGVPFLDLRPLTRLSKSTSPSAVSEPADAADHAPCLATAREFGRPLLEPSSWSFLVCSRSM